MSRVILITAASLDGRITRGPKEGNAFTSPADQAWFAATLDGMDAVLMGRGTYEAVRERLRARRDDASVPRIVFTRDPGRFAAEAGPGLQFTAESPTDGVARLRAEGKQRLALVGGAELHSAFFAADLVDEVWVTLEPWIFGRGKLLAPDAPEVALEFLAHEFLSPQSLLLKYRVRPRSEKDQAFAS